MDKYSGRVAFWEKYETSDFIMRKTLLTPIATNIMKDIGVSARSVEIWGRKRDLLVDNLIKGYNILLEVKNEQIKEFTK